MHRSTLNSKDRQTLIDITLTQAKLEYFHQVFHTAYGWVTTDIFDHENHSGKRPWIDIDDLAERAQRAKDTRNPSMYALSPQEEEQIDQLNKIAIKQCITKLIAAGKSQDEVKQMMQNDPNGFKALCNQINEQPPKPTKNDIIQQLQDAGMI